ncbi:EAL domain-containing protein [Listeria costaricensis]|uniref:EAL domain-containing protein n=1 Tax=Listeria costaricensis TaxID=2026604 RepID=UPI000C0773B7|nr:EAL domain-containing protein [Listeria costaricensis]
MAIPSREIMKAISQKNYLVYYQPKVDAQTEALMGFEALIRLKVGEKILTPELFFEDVMAIQAGIDMQQFVVAAVLEQVNKFQGRFSISVNIPAPFFMTDLYMDEIYERIKRDCQFPQQLTLEIIERGEITELESARKNIQRLKTLGLNVVMDDFGKGYSSLTYLRALPIDGLKTDRSFISFIKQDEKQRTIVRAIINLCHDLGGKIVIEGVEDEEQIQLLREMKADYFQGYYYGKPMPIEEAARKFQL